MLEKGRLYCLRKDGAKDSVCLNIKHKRFLFGSSEKCAVRIYIDGVYPKHCVLTFEDQGKAYLEPLHPSALLLVNGMKVKRKVFLKNCDLVTISGKEFQFVYPLNSLFISMPTESLLAVPFSKQVCFELQHESPLTSDNGAKIQQKICFKKKDGIEFENKFQLAYTLSSLPSNVPVKRISNKIESPLNFQILTLERNLETPSFRQCEAENLELIGMPKSHRFRPFPEYLLKFAHYDCVNILYGNISDQKAGFSWPDKPLMKYRSKCVGESIESRKHLAYKLYEFFIFIIELLEWNKECIFDLLPLLRFIWKCYIVRANDDLLFLPLKYLYLYKVEIILNKLFVQSRISPHSFTNLPLNSEDSNAENLNCVSLKLICLIDRDIFRAFSGYLLKFAPCEFVNISYENIKVQEANFPCIKKPLMKYMNHFVGESTETRKNLALKLYKFFIFIKELLNRNEEYETNLLSLLQSVYNYSIARANIDVLFLPLKYIYLKYLNKDEVTVNDNSSIPSFLPLVADYMPPNSEIMSKKKSAIEWNQDSKSSRRISISYRKRVSLAVKRYQLRKRKSMMMANCAETENANKISGEQENCEETNKKENIDTVSSKEKQRNKKAAAKKTALKEKIEVEVVHDTIGKENFPAVPTKEKQKNKARAAKKTVLKQEINVEAVHDTVGDKNIPAKLTKEKRKNKKTVVKKNDLEQEINVEAVHDPDGDKNIDAKSIKEKRKNKKTAIKKNDLEQEIDVEAVHKIVDYVNIPAEPKKERRNNKKTAVKKNNLEQEINVDSVHDTVGDENIPVEPTKEKRKNKKTVVKKNDLEKEISMAVQDTVLKENIATKPRKENRGNKKAAAKKTDLSKSTQECCEQELPSSQRITRSMVKKRQ